MTKPNTFDIRIVPSSDPANLLLGDYAFASTPKVRSKEEDERYLNQRSDDTIFFSYLENEPVAKVGVIPMTQNVRGKVVPMGGITGVASMPVARRGGHIRALMNRSIERMHTEGQAVSTLYPFKSSYYEAFGYAGWQVPMWARIAPAALAPYLKLRKHGTIQQRLGSDAEDEFHAFLCQVQKRLHGMSSLPKVRFDNGVERYPVWLVSVREGDEITGGISYKIDSGKEILEAQSAFWTTMNGKLNLLDFLARHVDQVKQIRIPLTPGEDPHLWASEDGGITLLSNEDHAWNAPMARIVTVPGLAGINVGDGEATITLHDAQAPWNDGTCTLRSSGGELTISEGGTPGGTISINGLAALVFSGIDPELLSHRGWGTVNDETSAALHSLFPPVMPHLHEMF